uniref:DED domain-containing protein n=1 Tax=Ciona savignyi TaxID=51511 RepID=H2Y454_CIOSA
MKIEGPLSELVNELIKKLKPEDLPGLLDSSKDDGIDNKELEELKSVGQWLEWMHNKYLLTEDDMSFIEHVFELCRRPDLLATVLEYRLKNLDTKEEELPARQLLRVSSSKKYIATTLKTPNKDDSPDLKLADPPKTRRKSTAS